MRSAPTSNGRRIPAAVPWAPSSALERNETVTNGPVARHPADSLAGWPEDLRLGRLALAGGLEVALGQRPPRERAGGLRPEAVQDDAEVAFPGSRNGRFQHQP